ncbi:zinc finger FYVE domain-containing protein 16 [Notechis scutatus]|uniref:Zinc finger FYVE domain-containing protein n=1 Tax=Notechis scutatus TaxID=8663 RepID=A0A6J1UI90_9SAUR|nr:zinc finger FYVE domain-containing protein 16 [Notechis scutatus]XP_026527594.1 zinc finger FYVE domain-containing protein 16 [Notechis scutatus]
MDNYFKAAVSDLDKLLDEFEQHPDELENNSTINLCNSEHHLVLSDSSCQQPKTFEPNVEENASCAVSDVCSLSSQTTKVASFEQLNSDQNEKNVTGLDLLSMVGGDSSDKNQSSCLKGCSIPVCDLINDTGGLNQLKNNLGCIQKLQPDESQYGLSIDGFDLALLSTKANNSVVDDHISNSGTQQQIDETLYKIQNNAAGELNQQELKTDTPFEPNITDSGEDQEKTNCLKNNKIPGQKEQVIGTDGESASVIHLSAVLGSKEESTYEKLPCETLVDENSSKSQMIRDESGKQGISEDINESEVLHLPKIHEVNNPNVMCNKKSLCDSALQTESVLALNKEHSTTDMFCNAQQYTDATLNTVSVPEISEDIQTSLSCLPLAVSICTSLVNTDDINGKITQKEDSIRDIALPSENSFAEGDSFGKTETLEKENSLNQISECEIEKSSLISRDCVVSSNSEPFQHHDSVVTTSTFLAKDTEMCSSVWPIDVDERPFVDLVLEEDIIGSNILISDSELDAFLSEHCLGANNSKPLKEDTSSGLLESDVINDNLLDISNLNISRDRIQAELECKKAKVCNENNFISIPESSLGILVKKHTQQVQQETVDNAIEIGSEISDSLNGQPTVHSGGARPKQLLNLQPKAPIPSEFSSKNAPGNESQMKNSTDSNTFVSDGKISPESDVSHSNVDGQRCLGNMKENVLPMVSEPRKVVGRATVLGQKQPSWLPDLEASKCMNCQAKFTFTKRRHHCRACGKIFCAPCCNRKCKLQYLDKEARVCISCYESINKAQALEKMMIPTGPASNSVLSESSAVPSLHETQTSGLLPKDHRRVWFADGILPNGEVADTTKLSSGAKRFPQEPVGSPTNEAVSETDTKSKDEMHVAEQTGIARSSTSVPHEDILPTNGQLDLSHNSDCLAQTEVLCDSDSMTAAVTEFPSVSEQKAKEPLPAATDQASDTPTSILDYRMLCCIENCVGKEVSLIPGDGFPPLLLARGEKGKESLVEEHPSNEQVTLLLEESNPLTFILNANLLVNVKILSYNSEKCWFFSTNGMHGLGQAEIIIVLHCLSDESDVPKEIFNLFINIYKDAMKGKFIGNLENIIFTEDFLGSKEHGGFLFVTPTFQKLDDLMLPSDPFLCGILIHKQEVPWAKVFPIRLMLRLGAEYGVYPTPLTSIRHRKPLFGKIGHTVMDLLVDLRNYQYTLHRIDNLFIHMEMGRSYIKIPLRKYNEIMKVINTSNEHVISIGASFNSQADSHLVCVQNEDGVYQTQANSATGHPRKITGASFVVFNGALKTSSGFLAKSSIVEDGIMIQITPETMEGLRQALSEKKDFRITCGKVDSGDFREYVDICWIENDEKTNMRITSPIDGKSMEGVRSEKIVQEECFEVDGKLVKCTEVFYLSNVSELHNSAHQLAKEIALASYIALGKHLKTLKNNGMNKIGLRVSMDADMVEYQAGSGGQVLPQHYLNDLDSALIPVIHGWISNTTSLPLEIELIFFINESLLI